MENLKEKLPAILGVLVVLFLCFIAYYYIFIFKTYYYTRVDNQKVEILETSDNMKYEYTLECYKENGNKKKIKFKTSRKLKDEAYLKIEYMELRGVYAWSEIEYNNMPSKVKEKYN